MRHPINKPHTHVRRDGNSQENFSTKIRNDVWSANMTGLVGWWRRIEMEQSKQEALGRKQEGRKRKEVEERRKKEDEKLNFVRKYFPGCSQTPGGSSKLRDETTLGLNMRQPGIGMEGGTSGTELNFSPNTKRKAGVGDIFGNYFSPSKKLKFQKIKEFWKSSESGNVEEPNAGLMLTLKNTTELAEID